MIKVMRGRLKEGIEFLMLAEAGELTGGEASDALPEDSLDKPIINHPGKLHPQGSDIPRNFRTPIDRLIHSPHKVY